MSLTLREIQEFLFQSQYNLDWELIVDMGIWMRAEYSRFEPNHKSFIAGQKWKLIK